MLRVFVYDEWMGIGGGGAFGAFAEKTDFARNALGGKTRQRLDHLADRALKGGGTEACGKYAAAFLTALRDAPAEGPISEAADRSVALLMSRKQGNRIKP